MEGGLPLRPGAESDKQEPRSALPLAEPIYPTAHCIHGVKKNLVPLKTLQQPMGGELRVRSEYSSSRT